VNAADTVCEPIASDEVLDVATPLPFTVTGDPAEPSIVKTTDPVGVPPPLVTVAVNVTLWPKFDGFGELLTEVEVVAVTT